MAACACFRTTSGRSRIPLLSPRSGARSSLRRRAGGIRAQAPARRIRAFNDGVDAHDKNATNSTPRPARLASYHSAASASSSSASGATRSRITRGRDASRCGTARQSNPTRSRRESSLHPRGDRARPARWRPSLHLAARRRSRGSPKQRESFVPGKCKHVLEQLAGRAAHDISLGQHAHAVPDGVRGD